MAELHVNQGISNQDEQYFVDKVEENVRRIEEWFLKIRNKCFQRFEVVQNDLPKEIKSHLPCISEFTSFQQYQRKKSSDADKHHRKSKHKSHSHHHHHHNRKKQKKKRLKSGSSCKNNEDDDDINTVSTKKSSKSKSADSTFSSKSSTVSTAKISGSNENVTNIKDRVHIIDIQHNDQQQIDDIDDGGQEQQKQLGHGLKMNGIDRHHEDEEEQEDDCPTPVSSAYGETESEEDDVDVDDEHKYNLNANDDDEESFNERYLRKNIDGDLISPPQTLFIENAVFSHLPPSAHRECLSILLTLGKLKLFAWQNSEGVRKIIKKYDKRFSKTLTSTLWPKIKLNEFVQETKNDSYIAQVAAVLCTRTIPFGHLDANDLREKGVNLKQMADSIQQLEQVVAEDDLKEIVPMNVEPRSYMANERTFLKWMRMSALTTLVGMILLAMKHEPVTGVLLIILSIFVLIRSYHEYYKRNEVLVNRIEYGWIDNLGAKLLLLSLFIPMITYLVYLILYGSTTNIFHK